MSSGVNPAKNNEVYQPSFDRREIKNEVVESRENLIQTEKLERIDVADKSLEKYFEEIEEAMEKDLSEATGLVEIVIRKALYYFREVAKLPPEDLQVVLEQGHKYFDAYLASYKADLVILKNKLKMRGEVDAMAQTKEELDILQKERIKPIEDSHLRVSALCDIAKDKITNIFKDAFVKTEVNTYLKAA